MVLVNGSVINLGFYYIITLRSDTLFIWVLQSAETLGRSEVVVTLCICLYITLCIYLPLHYVLTH